jgi:hypothetical protein
LVWVVLVGASPASAHAVSGVSASNYETALTGVTPALPTGVVVRVVESGSRLELANRSDAEVVVTGYTDEPYLRVGPEGVFENLESPATYVNATRNGAQVPDGVDGTAAPRWKKVSSSSTARWHDHRIHWMGAEDHPLARRDPGHRHQLGEWTVTMRQGSSSFSVEGTLAWVPGPSPVPWYAVALVVAAGAAALLFVLAPRGDPRRFVVAAALLAVLLVVDVGHLVGTALAGADGLLTNMGRLAGASRASFVAWGVLVAAIVLCLRRRSWAWSLAVVGTLLVLVAGGISDLADLSRSQVPFEPSAVAVRALVAVTIGLAAAVTAAAAQEIAAGNRSSAPAAPSSPAATA